MKYYVLYNPYANNCKGGEDAKKLDEVFAGNELVYSDLTKIENYAEFFAGLEEDATVVLCGGDGTINRFVNNTKGLSIEQKLLYYACGSGNDFLRDVGDNGGKPIELTPYIKNLPTVNVKGKDYLFINGIGYGVDGYCCEEGDRIRETAKNNKPINYTGIAIKGVLYAYKPTDATVIVDGKEYYFKRVWAAPTMHGRYYGGGMNATPEQKRGGDKLSVMLFHGGGKLATLIAFPSIFKGQHVNKKVVTILSGKEITVRFTAPRPVQIDGETILEVPEYTAKI